MQWNEIPEQETIEKTIDALKANGMEAMLVDTSAQAKDKVLELIPEGSEVMTMTSETLRTSGISDAINNSNRYDAVMPKLYALDPKTQKREQKRLGAAPEYAVGSVHAVTMDGNVIVASNTGSQLPAYTYGSDHVIWVVGVQKITRNMEEGMKRVQEYVLPLESERARKAYGTDGSFISKLVIFNREVTPGRITVLFVKESVGF